MKINQFVFIDVCIKITDRVCMQLDSRGCPANTSTAVAVAVARFSYRCELAIVATRVTTKQQPKRKKKQFRDDGCHIHNIVNTHYILYSL